MGTSQTSISRRSPCTLILQSNVLACYGDRRCFTLGKCEIAGEVPELEGDFSLNAANTLSVHLLLGKGLQKLAPTHDLNAGQLAALGKALGPER